MAEFKPITTQEEFDAAIGERLKRENSKYAGYLSPEDAAKKYEGYLSPEDVNKKYGGYLSPEDVNKKYGGYLSPEDAAKKYEGYLSPEDAAKKDATIKGYETSSAKMRIALETGIPYELAEKLSGETEDEIRADAKIMSGFVSAKHQSPLRSTEPDSVKAGDEAYKNLLKSMRGEQ